MFGTDKKIQAAVSAVNDEYRRRALSYFDTQVKYMNGNGALAWLRGGLELAQALGVLSTKELEYFDSVGKAKYEANLKAQKEERERIAAERKAERAANAKAAK